MGHWMSGTVLVEVVVRPSEVQHRYSLTMLVLLLEIPFTFNSTTDTLSVLNLDVSELFQILQVARPTVLSANDLVLQADIAGEIRLKASNVRLTDSLLQIKNANAQLGALSNMIGQIAYISILLPTWNSSLYK